MHLNSKQTMRFSCLLPLCSWKENAKKTSWLTTWPRSREKEPTKGSLWHAQFIYSVKGFSVINQQILLRPKGIYLQINRKKKEKKKDTPTSSRRFTDTRYVQRRDSWKGESIQGHESRHLALPRWCIATVKSKFLVFSFRFKIHITEESIIKKCCRMIDSC